MFVCGCVVFANASLVADLSGFSGLVVYVCVKITLCSSFMLLSLNLFGLIVLLCCVLIRCGRFAMTWLLEIFVIDLWVSCCVAWIVGLLLCGF